MDGKSSDASDPHAQLLSAPDRSAMIFPWMVWAVMVASALALVARYGSNMPYMDEWNLMVPYVSGQEPLSWQFLWAQHNEHRLPLPKLLLVLLARLTHNDFRAGTYASVAVLSLAAALLMRTAKHLRGRWSYVDAFFPLTVLHWGHFENLLTGMQLCFTLPVLFVAILLSCILLPPQPVQRGRLFVSTIAVTALALCGGSGIALIPALSLWLLVSAIWQYKGANAWQKHRSLAAMVAALVPVLVLVAYFHGFQLKYPHSPNLQTTLELSVKCLATALGSAFAYHLWPMTGVLVLLMVGAATMALLIVVWRRPEHRYRCSGLFLISVGIATLLASVGWGRGGLSPQFGFASRYAVFGLPLLWSSFYAWDLVATTAARNLAQMILLTITCSTLSVNTVDGMQMGIARKRDIGSFEKAMNAGVPACLLAARYGSLILPKPYRLPERFLAMHDAGVGKFRRLNAPPYEIVSLPLHPAVAHQMQGTEPHWQATGSEPYLVFALGRAMQVDAVRVSYTLNNGSNPAPIRVSWGQEPRIHAGDPKHGCQMNVASGPEIKVLFFAVDETVDTLRLDPDIRPCDFHLHDIIVYARASGGPSEAHARFASVPSR